MWKFICPKFLLICLYFTINISMGIVNREGALYIATGVDNSGLYSGSREAMGIIKAMAGRITSFDVFSGIGISAATAFASAAKSSYDFEKEFQKNMLEVATISTQVEGSMTDFMNRVMAITQEIPIKAPEAAKALYQIVSAGHDGADGMKVLEVSARSAIGGMTDTATAADAITTLINAYKLSADDAEKVSDQLFTTARLGKTTFGELGQSIAQVAPIAASYGVEMDQVLAAVATLTKSGTPTAQAMTQIRAAIIGTSKVLGDGAFNSRTFQDALAEVANKAGGSESKLRELIPEVEAVNGVLGLTGIKAQDAAEHLKAMNDSAGATSAAFELMMNDVDKQMTLLSNNIQATLRPMGETILKNVSEAAKTINHGFETGDVQNSMENLKKLLIGVAGAYVTYKSSVIGASAAEAFHSAKVSISNNLKTIQNSITGESIIAKEKERLYQEAYNASLEKTITEEQRAKLSKMNLKAGSEEYIKALTDQAMQEKKNADNLVESLTKQVETNKVKLASAKENLDISQKSVEAAKAEFDAAFAANDLAALEVAQTKMNAAAKREEAAATNVSTSAKKLKSTESKLLIASTNAENATTRINTATIVADTAVTNVATGAKNRLKVATIALWGVMKANPLGAILTMISLATTAYMLFADKINAAETAQSRLNKLQKATADNMANEQAELRLLLSVAKNELISKKDREKAIKKLNDISPEYLSNLSLENLRTKEATDSIEAYTRSIEKNAKMKAAQDMAADKYKAMNDIQVKMNKYLNKKKQIEDALKNGTFIGDETLARQEYAIPLFRLGQERDLIQKEIDQILSFAQDQAEKKPVSIPVNVQLETEHSYLKTLFEKKAEIEARINEKKGQGLFVDAFDMAELAAVNKELTITNEKIISLNKNVSETDKKESSSITNEIKVATEKVSTLKQELADLRSGKTTVEAGKTVQAVIEGKVKELKAAEESLAILTGIDKKGSESLKKTKQEQSDLLLEISRNAKERENAERQTALEIAQAKIDIMKDGYQKEQAQIDLNHQKALQSVKQRGEEMLKAQQDAERKQWEKDGKKGVFTPATTSVSQLPIEQLQQLAGLMNGVVTKTDHDSKELFDNMIKKYQTYAEQRKEIEKKFDDEIRSMQDKNVDGKYDANIKEAEKLKNKALSDLDTSIIANKSMWSRLFADTSAMSKKQIKQILSDIKHLTDYLEGVDLTIPVGFTEEQLKSLKEDPEKIKAIYDELIKKQEELDDRTNYPLSGFTKGFDKLKESADLARKAMKATTEEEKHSLEYQAEAVKAKGMQYIADGAVEAADGVSFLADKLSELAKATGDERLSETAEQFGAIAQNFAAAGKGFQSGGWIGAIIGGATDMITQTFSAFATAKAEAKEYEDNRRDFLNEYNLLQLRNRMSAEDQDNVFGTSALKRASEAAKVAQDAMAQYTEEITKRTAPEIRKEFNSLGAAIFSGGMFGGWLGLGNRVSNESKVLMKSYKKGYSDLQAMAVKTRDYSGWANFWGKKDKYTSLKDLAPQLWDKETGDFDIDAAKAFLETNTQINDEQRKQIQNVIDLKEAYDEALQVLKDDVADTFGSLGEGVLDSIVGAVQNGDIAINKFSDSVGKTFEKLGKKIMQELFFQKEFDKLQEDLLKTYDLGNSEAIANSQMDIVSRFFDTIGSKMDAAETWLEDWKKKAAEKGFSIFGEDDKDWLGTTADSITQSILNGIRGGKTGIKEFSGDFEDAMKTAVMNSIKMQYLETPMKEFYKKFANFSESGGQLTKGEIEELRGMYNDIVTGALSQFDAIKEISGLDFSDTSDNTLKGAYAKANQESIDLLAGQTGAQRVAIESIREQMQFIRDLQVQGWKDVEAIKVLVGKLKEVSDKIYDAVDEIKGHTGELSEYSERTVNAVEGTLNVKVKM